MKYIYSLIIMFFPIIFSINSANANDCPYNHDMDKGGTAITGYINYIYYDNKYDNIAVTMNGYAGYDYTSMQLSANKPYTTDQGKLMVKLALFAKAHDIPVTVECHSGNIRTIELTSNY